ncbi:hypothetical protein BC628DRAFT_1496704 [Trametes gibbosa]|nr:hypothetical protein BC628DRAFT_1496704 [Trametes gibbosa]
MPFKIPSVRIAQASPSISLEKGSYRLRAPPSRPAATLSVPSSTLGKARQRTSTQNVAPILPRNVAEFVPASYEKRMALLVALLACAALASFGTAYWLWHTGHARR